MGPKATAERARQRANAKHLPGELFELARGISESGEVVAGYEWANDPLPTEVGALDSEIGAYLEFFSIANEQVA
jgi:hypothetical protein